jgi:hypothetical protein
VKISKPVSSILKIKITENLTANLVNKKVSTSVPFPKRTILHRVFEKKINRLRFYCDTLLVFGDVSKLILKN